MGEILVFDYMNKESVSTHVEINLKTKEVICTNYTEVLPHQFIGKRPSTIESVNEALEHRCFSKQRPDKKLLLSAMGLTQYNPLDIVAKTHGVMSHDFNWIRFEGEKLTYSDVGIRD